MSKKQPADNPIIKCSKCGVWSSRVIMCPECQTVRTGKEKIV